MLTIRWICRKGWAAINMQATVDSSGKFMEYSLRPGSCSDKNLWTLSTFWQNVAGILKLDMHLVGDAGYTLTDNLMIPYEITDNMPRSERQFNYFTTSIPALESRSNGRLAY